MFVGHEGFQMLKVFLMDEVIFKTQQMGALSVVLPTIILYTFKLRNNHLFNVLISG